MKLIHILLVEDDPLDVINIRRNLNKLDIQFTLDLVNDGEEALSYLNEKLKSISLPDIILIDNSLPKLNGIELLQILRESKDFKKLKCFMITGSNQVVDRQMAKLLGISGYIIKPLKLDDPRTLDSLSLIVDLLNF